MHPAGRSHYSFRGLLRLLALAALVASPAQADLLHKYTFNDNSAEDSAGTAHGTVIDNTGIHTYTGGALDLTANNGADSQEDFSLPTTVGAYVDLPNGIFKNAITSGGGQATLEIWLTVQQNRNWAEAYSFGSSNNGENTSDGGDNAEYVALIPQSGAGDFRATTKTLGAGAETPIIGSPTPLPVNQQHHIVLVLDHLDPTAGINGTASLYLNNAAPATAEIRPLLDLINDNNNWLGRSQWPDALFDGLIDEFRIYNHALTPAEIDASFDNGPDAEPLPVLVVNRDTGAITLANQTDGNIQLKGYSIGSAAGSLNPAAWQSIDAGNVFDPNGTWTSSALTNLEIAEANTGGTLDGGMLAPSTSRGVGSPWLKTPFEDLSFSFTLGDGSVANGVVQYIGGEPIRSDLNGDSQVTAADWLIFSANSYTSLAGQPAAQAYLKGDLDGDLDNDFTDFRVFKTDFIAANGEAAFAALTGAVPEPATAMLGAVAAALLAGTARRRVNR